MLLMGACTLCVFAQNIASWDFEPDPGTTSPAMVAANASAGNAEFGPTNNNINFFGGNGSDEAYSAANWPTGGISGDRYIEFSVEAAPGFVLNITGITFDERRSNSGPTQFDIASSSSPSFSPSAIYSSALNVGLPDNDSWRTQIFTQTVNGVETYVFRIFGKNTESTGGTWRFDNVSIQGTVENAPISVSDTIELVCETDLADTLSGSISSMDSVVWYQLDIVNGLAAVNIELESATFDTQLGLYDVDGNLLADDDDGGSGALSRIQTVLPSGTYFVSVSEFFTEFLETDFGLITGGLPGAGDFDISFTLTDCDINPPVNDLCENAIELTDGVTVTGTTIDATIDGNIPNECFDAESDEPGVWYSYTPATDGNIQVIGCADSASITDVWVFSGTCDSLFCEDGEDDDCLSGGIVNVPVIGGVEYLIFVNADDSGNDTLVFDLTVTLNAAPENDNCVDAIMVELGEMVSGNTEFAASENDITYAGNDCSSPSSSGNNDDQGIWYSFVAPAQPVTIMAMGFDSIEVALHAGTCDSLNCLEDEEDMGSEDAGGDGMVTISDIQLNEGETYLVYVEGLNGANGMFMVEACTNELSCNDTIVALDETGSLIIDESFVAMASCPSDDFELSQTLVTCEDLITPVSVTVTLGDTSCVSIVSVLDTTAPVVLCQNDTVYLDESGNGSTSLEEVLVPGDLTASRLINFDGLFAPGLFGDQDRPTNDYSNGDIDFENNDGEWEVLNNESFGPPTGLSDPNKWAWNAGTGNTSAAMNFIFPASNVSFLVAAGEEVDFDFTAEAFDGMGNSLEVITISMVPTSAVTVSFSASEISRIELLAASNGGEFNAGCVDDVSYVLREPNPSDNCEVAVVELSQADFDCSNLGDNMVQVFAFDLSENEGSCSVVVTVLDTFPATLFCQDTTLQLDENGMASIDADELVLDVSDNCSSPTEFTLSQTEFTCDDLGANVVTVEGVGELSPGNLLFSDFEGPFDPSTWTFEEFGVDQDGESATFDFSTTTLFMNTTSDSISCEGLLYGELTHTFTEAGFLEFDYMHTTDDEIPSLDGFLFRVDGSMDTLIQLEGSGSGVSGSVEVIVKVGDMLMIRLQEDDGCLSTLNDLDVTNFRLSAVIEGSSGICEPTITVVDEIAPVISCISDTIYLDENGMVSDAPGENVTIIEDNCPPSSIVGDPLAIFTCDDLGVNEFNGV
ncbi:MAG: hypothetical protein AAGF87_13715, partial [Bacteroidota bacterium]